MLINPIIHFDILIFYVLNLQLNVLVGLTLIIPVNVLFDNMCTEAMPASLFVSLTSRFALSPKKHSAFVIGMPLSDALRVQPQLSAKVKEHIAS